MTDNYKVIIIDAPEYSGSLDEYELFQMWVEGGTLPDGTWMEDWVVPDGHPWDSHPAHQSHHLCKHSCYLIEWSEIGELWNLKCLKWWKDKEFLLHSIEEAQVKLEILAERHINEVIEVLGMDDGEDFAEYIQGHEGRITDTMVTSFILSKVNTTIKDIRGNEIVVDAGSE